MESHIMGLLIQERGLTPVDIFGYCTKGIPGMEIIGMGPQGKKVKEKFIYMTRQRNLKLPLKRYVLCADLKGNYIDKTRQELDWLELPLFLLFLFLGGKVTIYGPKDCLACGQVGADGQLTNYPFTPKIFQEVLQKFQERGMDHIKILSPYPPVAMKGLRWIDIRQLLTPIPNLKFLEN